MKVFKIIVIALLAHFAWANNSIKSNVTNLSANKVSAINTEGGWSPMFFTQYDKSRVKEIIAMVQDNKVKAIKIIYPNQKYKLANKIKAAIQSTANISISTEEVNLTDTSETTFNKDQVVVILYYGSR